MFLPSDETNGFNNQRGLKGPFHNYCLPLAKEGAGAAGQSMDDGRRAEWDVCHLHKRAGGGD